jgi:sugar lactone lactonase YvrE
MALSFTVALSDGAGGQQMTGVAPVDSSAVARAAWGRAAVALRAHDLAVARSEVDRAARAWPTQHSYIWASAALSARTLDTAATLSALQEYAALGLGRDLWADTSFAPFLDRPTFAPVIAWLDKNRAPLVRSAVRATLADSTFWPEGMDFDPRTKRFFVASVRYRTIAVIDSTGATHELWPRGRRDLGAILGVRVDTMSGTLWATTSGVRQMEGYQPGDSAIAALLRIRPSDGTIERRWDIAPVAGGHVIGDLGLGPHGDVFLTDSNQPVLYWLRPGADSLETIRHPLFHSLQGLAPSPDGRLLYLSDYSHGLLRVDLTTRGVTRVDDAPNSTSLGCDGIAWDRGAIVAVQNGVSPARVMRFVLDASGTRIARSDVLDQNVAVADEPTIGAVVGDEFVYVANSQWEKHDDDGKRLPGRPLTAPILLAVRLPR